MLNILGKYKLSFNQLQGFKNHLEISISINTHIAFIIKLPNLNHQLHSPKCTNNLNKTLSYITTTNYTHTPVMSITILFYPPNRFIYKYIFQCHSANKLFHKKSKLFSWKRAGIHSDHRNDFIHFTDFEYKH